MITIAICDADADELNSLASITKGIFQEHVHIRECNNYFTLETLVFDETKSRVDIVFMDLKIEGTFGINLANQIQKEYPYIQIAFIGDAAEDARYIFMANPAYFLIKPIQSKDLSNAINRMVGQLKLQIRHTFVFETKKGFCPIPHDNIVYIESQKRVIYFHLNDNRIESGYGKLDEIQKRLPRQFVRCHQSYIANMNKILYFTTNNIVFEDETLVPISRPKNKKVKEIMFDYLDRDYEQMQQTGVYQ